MRHLLSAVGLLVASAASAQELPLKVAQGTSKQLSSKPAEIFHNEENGESSSSLNLAVIGNGILLDALTVPGRVTSELVFGASISKTNLKSKPQDVRALQAALASEIQLAGAYSLASTLSYDIEDNREKGAQGHMERLDLFLTGLCGGGGLQLGESGMSLKCYPYAGYYHRKISDTDDAVAAPLGSHAGPYGGITMRLSFGEVGMEGNWWAPIRLEVNAYKLKDTSVRGGYARKSYDFAAMALSYALYSSEKSKWKPSISLSREVGTDRLSNKEHVRQTKLGFQLGYQL